MKKETEDAQNIIFRLKHEIHLNIKAPNQPIKKQFNKVEKLLIDLNHELDLLNDMKAGLDL